MALMPMYPGQPNSPQTELAENIDETQTTIPLLDASVLPPGPNLAVIGGGEHAETVLYESIDGNNLINCTRGFQGVASSWQAGQKVARNFTAYDYDALRQNLESHGSEHNHDGADPIPDLVQVQQDLAEHLDEDVSDDAHGFLTTKRMHVGTFTRSTTLDSGIQAITGIGFRPKLVLFLATVVAMEGLMSIGFDDGASPTCLFDNHLSTPNSYSSAGYSIRMQQGSSGGFRYSGRIQALNSDGFTMLWDKSDSAVEGQTIQVNYVAFM